jgi:hypothetical protein
VFAAVLSDACVGGGGQFRDLEMPFIGTWQIASGTDTPDCGNGPLAPTEVGGSVIVNSGADPGTLQVRDSNHGTCMWILTASTVGLTATLRSAKECVSQAVDTNQVIMPKDYVMTLMTANSGTVMSNFQVTVPSGTCTHIQEETIMLMTQ